MPVNHRTIQKLIHGDSVISFICKNYLELKFNILSFFIGMKGLFQFVLVPECKLPTVSIVLKQLIFQDFQTLPLIGPLFFFIDDTVIMDVKKTIFRHIYKVVKSEYQFNLVCLSA